MEYKELFQLTNMTKETQRLILKTLILVTIHEVVEIIKACREHLTRYNGIQEEL